MYITNKRLFVTHIEGIGSHTIPSNQRKSIPEQITPEETVKILKKRQSLEKFHPVSLINEWQLL